jgi:hypothetical protein
MPQQSLSELPYYDPLRPIAPQAKWWIVGAVMLLLGAWELSFNRLMMHLPVATAHHVSAAVAALLVTGVTLAVFRLVQRYERHLAHAAVALRRKNEALRALEADRDTGLLNVARDLALVLVDLTEQCEVARGLADPAQVIQTLVRIQQRAHNLQAALRALIDLREEGTGLTEYLPPLLDDNRVRARWRRAGGRMTGRPGSTLEAS